jgi:surface antigen
LLKSVLSFTENSHLPQEQIRNKEYGYTTLRSPKLHFLSTKIYNTSDINKVTQHSIWTMNYGHVAVVNQVEVLLLSTINGPIANAEMVPKSNRNLKRRGNYVTKSN